MIGHLFGAEKKGDIFNKLNCQYVFNCNLQSIHVSIFCVLFNLNSRYRYTGHMKPDDNND